MPNQFIPSKPDFNRLLKTVTLDGAPDRVPFFEIFGQIEDPVLDALKQRDPSFERLCPAESGDTTGAAAFKRHVSYMYATGYDYCTVIPDFEFTKSLSRSDITDRDFLTSHDAMIRTRDDFDNYPWPDAARMDLSPFAYAEQFMPVSMKVSVYSRGPHLAALYLLGYEGLSYMLADDEKLLSDVINTAGERVLECYKKCAAIDIVGALGIGEDLAFYGATYLPPDILRKHVFPWYKKIVRACHEYGKPAIFHSCGNNEAVMEDIIACGFDAKHSFEDKITPVWEEKRKWGGRIAVLGGFDMHKISSLSPAEVKKHVAFLMDNCKAGGGWALGTGNSVAVYVPVENFLAMIDEGFLLGKY